MVKARCTRAGRKGFIPRILSRDGLISYNRSCPLRLSSDMRVEFYTNAQKKVHDAHFFVHFLFGFGNKMNKINPLGNGTIIADKCILISWQNIFTRQKKSGF